MDANLSWFLKTRPVPFPFHQKLSEAFKAVMNGSTNHPFLSLQFGGLLANEAIAIVRSFSTVQSPVHAFVAVNVNITTLDSKNAAVVSLLNAISKASALTLYNHEFCAWQVLPNGHNLVAIIVCRDPDRLAGMLNDHPAAQVDRFSPRQLRALHLLIENGVHVGLENWQDVRDNLIGIAETMLS